MNDLILEFPTINREKDAKEFIDELISYDSQIHGTGGLDGEIEDYSKWINKTNDFLIGQNLNGWVPATTYFLVKASNNQIIGMVNIRHYLNDFLKVHGYGHIGYCIRPTQRRKGYATKMLGMALEECRKLKINNVHVGCDKDNMGSKRTIEKNGGNLYRELEGERCPYLEYIIEI